MLELNSRCIQLLRELVSRQLQGVSVSEILTRFDMTRRALSYDLSKISSWLSHHKLGTVEITSGRLILFSTSFSEISALLSSFSSYHFSVEERLALALLCIALDIECVTIERLQSLLFVSQNTIIGDIKKCKALITTLPVNIVNVGKKGYKLVGEEVAVRKVIGQQLYVLQNEYPKSTVNKMLQELLVSLTGNDVDFRQLVKTGVEDYERSLNTWLVMSEMHFEIAMILSACIRCLKGHPYKADPHEKEILKNVREYSAVLLIIRKMYDAKIDLKLDESYYITILFLGIKNFDFSSTLAENSYIQQFSINLVCDFERISCVSFNNKHQFLDRLCQHIRPMYYRLKYGISMGNTLLGQIQEMYSSIYKYTLRAVERSSGEISGLITEDELSYLCIYMVSYLSESTLTVKQERYQVLVICGAGVAASVLLKEQLAELLGDLFEFHLVPAPQLAYKNLSDYCLIVTTVPLESKNNNIVQTGPILSENSKSLIINILGNSQSFLYARQHATEILEVVRKSVKLFDESNLFRDLIKYSMQKEQVVGNIGFVPKMRDVIKNTSSIRLCSATTVEDAVWEGCGILGSGFHREVYSQQMLSHILPKGDLCAISNETMIEYCLKSGTGIVSMGVVIMPGQPIQLGTQKMRILVILGTIDNTTHQKLLDEIYNYFDDEQLCKALIHATNEQEASNIILAHMDKTDMR